MIWELGRAAAALEEKGSHAEVSNELVFFPSAHLVSHYQPEREEPGYTYPVDSLDQIATNANLTMSKVSQIINYGPSEYLIAGQSASGKPMLAIVVTQFWRGAGEPI
ncbi:hypothetical protein [Ferrimonas lipolytica]|uniref:Uncharacterized protein n=1 Tax=Ferrimonas lipolytica TaxID=2724191 RepID=A0A6H1UF72_9GAMM|nr:hypothetical protein [Ferrimonas lipolytica]QIZ77731.1 hypothetical protein HER31_12985 [Ferrimonas lipolytica]